MVRAQHNGQSDRWVEIQDRDKNKRWRQIVVLDAAPPPSMKGVPIKILSSNVAWEMFKPSRERTWEMYTSAKKVWKIFTTSLKHENADIVALQEFPETRYADLKIFAEENDYTCIITSPPSRLEGMATLYRSQQVGKHTHCNFSEYKPGRPWMRVAFSNFTFVNLHSFHGNDVERRLKPFQNERDANTPHILAGDFNHNMVTGAGDYRNRTSQTTRTCCSTKKKNRKFTKTFDHILVSSQWDVQKKTTALDFKYSDHKAVVATVALS